MDKNLRNKNGFDVERGIFVLFMSVLLSAISCTADGLEKQVLTITRTDGSSIDVEAEIARTDEERQFGYMEREVIPEGTGMLFMFEHDQILNFWMKNTPSPLSIAYIDSRGTIREIYDMTPFSIAGVAGTVSCRYALEVPQGWFLKNGIEVGCTIEIPD